MQDKNATATRWTIGCAAILVLVLLAGFTWLCYSVAKGGWLIRSVALFAALLGLAALIRRARANRRNKQNTQLKASRYTELPGLASLGQGALLDIPENIIYNKRYFSNQQVARMLANGTAVNGNAGGLIVGRSHAEGGIPVLFSLADGGYEVCAEFEGYEYLLNPGVVTCFRQECEDANQPDIDRTFTFAEYVAPANITLIDLRTLIHPTSTKYLIIDGTTAFFVVNKHSTKLKLQNLERLNESVTYEQWRAWAAKN